MEGPSKRCKSQWSTKYRSRSLGQGTRRVRRLKRSTMQGLVVVGLTVEILNVNVKCVKGSGAQNIGQGHGSRYLPSHTSRSTMQGLVVRGLTLEEIWNADVNYVEVTPAKIFVNFTRSRYLPSQYIEKKHFSRFGGCRPYSWGDIERRGKMYQSHWSAKYRSRSLGQCTCWVSTSRRSTMQGLVVVGLIVEKIWTST